MLTMEIDETRAIASLGGMPAAMHSALVAKVSTLRFMLEDKVKMKLRNDVLHIRSGNLLRSIFSNQIETPTSVTGFVASSGDVKYGAIHEYGGKTRAHEILPKKGNVLAFMIGGRMVFAKRVNHPGSVMPERSFMRSSFGEMRAQIVEELTGVVGAATK